eukprot:jgi/Picre1/31980/NNA_007328.t1
MDEMRAMLDDLMGKHRDVPLTEREKFVKERKFSDQDVCKYYLCGLCPYEEFKRTKNDLGSCPKEHDSNCREQWNRLSEREKERYGYERDLKRWLDRLEAELKKRKDANLARINATQKNVYLAEDQAALDRMATQIEELLLGAQRDADTRSGNNITKGLVQSVCPVSGLILNDEEGRLRDHHSGRNYNAWKKVHEKHAELEEKFEKRRRSRQPERSRSPRRRRSDRDDYSSSRRRGHAREGIEKKKTEDDDSEEEEGQVIG